MMHRLRASTALALLLLLAWIAGCSSSPRPHYYLLEPQQSEITLNDGLSVGLHPVTIPVYLQRSSLLTDSTNGNLRYSEQGRWGEPLADGVYRVSVMDLATGLKTGQLRTWPWSGADRPDIEVTIAILAMERQGSKARLTADIGILHRKSKDSWKHYVNTWTVRPADESDSATATAYSELVRAMNEHIAMHIGAGEASAQ